LSLIFGIISQFAHNLILLFVVIPIVTPILIANGVSPALFVFLFMMALNTAMGTPGGCAISAMMFGNSEWIDTKMAYKYAITFVVISMVVIFTIGLAMANVLL